jgi:hypothetical protein
MTVVEWVYLYGFCHERGYKNAKVRESGVNTRSSKLILSFAHETLSFIGTSTHSRLPEPPRLLFTINLVC